MYAAVWGDSFSRIEAGTLGVFTTRWEAERCVAEYLQSHPRGTSAWVKELA